MSITLYKKDDTTPYTFTQSKPILQDKDGKKFITADVTAGNWIFYAKEHYHAQSNDVRRVMGGEKHVNIQSVNGSMFLVDEGLILFKDFGFRGERKVLRI